MRLHLVFRPDDLPGVPACSGALVVDVLRATSVMVTLVAAGAPSVVLARDIDHAVDLRRRLGEGWYTSGARGGRRVEGFDFGNAMAEFATLDLRDRRFILSTTNGTGAIYRVRGLTRSVWVGSLLNASATARAMASFPAADDRPLLVVLSGVLGRYSLDDGLVAGVILDELVALRPDAELSDEARTCLLAARGAGDIGAELRSSLTGRCLLEAGLGDEVDFVLDRDRYATAVVVVPGPVDDALGLTAVTEARRTDRAG